MKIYTIIEQNDKYIKLSSANEITIIPIVDVILVDDNSGYISIKNTASRKTIGLIKKSVGPVPPTPTPTTQIICKYNVTSTSEPTRLLWSNSNIEYQIIDGVQQQSVQTTYTFDTTGEHTVEYTLTDNTEVGENMFLNCTNLTYVTLPDSVTTIGRYAFGVCTGLTSITIPDSVTSIGDFVFQSCISLTSVTIPSGVTSISYAAFNGCYSLTNVIIPNSVTSIGNAAFQSCSGLTSITIPNSVTSIGDSVFYGCTSLTSVTIPDSVTSIGSSVFKGCTALTSVTIGNGVTSIGYENFYNCTGLTSVTIPSGVTSIGDYTFYNCTGLTSVTVEATTPPRLSGRYVFDNTNNCPIYVPDESVTIYKTAQRWSSYASRITPIQ